MANLQLKEKQYEVLKYVTLESKDVLAVLPTGYDKSLIYQLLPPVFDFLEFRGKPTEKKSTVLVISLLSALIRDQIVKMREGGLNVCVSKGDCVATEEDDSEETSLVSVPLEKLRKEQFELIFAHLEVVVDNKNVSKVLKSPAFKERVKAIVVDEAHLVVDWYVERSSSSSCRFIHIQ